MPDAMPGRDPTALRASQQARDRAIASLWDLATPATDRADYLFILIDAARDERIYPTLRRIAREQPVLCLYQGQTAKELAAVAPYLVCLGTGNRVFDWLWTQGWGASWGIYLWSLVTPEVLREHFRRLTMVRTEAGGRLLFRFYDPRVLLPFLPTCDTSQLREVFGPVQRYLIESEDGAVLSEFRYAPPAPGRTPGLNCRTVHLLD